MDVSYYPLHDFGPAMKGIVIGGLGIVHVFLAQFAIGGGLLMCYFQWLAQTGREPTARKFVDGYFKLLVLISFVIGALTGVGMWFTTIQISPRTIGLMVSEFHWMWAIEWTFFSLEITAGYAFYRYGKRLDDTRRSLLLALYALAAWFSLFWINGILSWQLTPGAWLTTGNVWDGFFNAGFWPSLLFRTIVSMTIASLVAGLIINVMPQLTREERTRLIHRAVHLQAPMVLMPVLGWWYFGTMPADSRQWATGGSIAMLLFLAAAIGASLLIGVHAVAVFFGRQLYVNAVTSSLLILLALAATAGGEFVREGVRKPYTIRHTLYSYGYTPKEVAWLRQRGCTTDDPYPLLHAEHYPQEQVRLGAKVFRDQCSICHTLEGANALVHLAGSWTPDQQRMNIAHLQRTKPFMPPFAGTAEELEALVQLLNWTVAAEPREWPLSQEPRVLAQDDKWLRDAGVEPGVAPLTQPPPAKGRAEE